MSINEIDVDLAVRDITDQSGYISWRVFSPDEKRFIDGVQIRFTELVNGAPASGVPGTSPFIHRYLAHALLLLLSSNDRICISS